VASLLVEPKDGAGILESSDFVTMSRHRPGLARSPGPALLDEFQLTPSEANGCALLHLRAPDRIGLLAGVLDAILRSDLRPRRLSVRTRNGRAEDWLELESAAAAAPTTDSLDALRAQLTTGLATSGTI
jgi:UTP:GlnB (protein PII) uridylyltransferase